MSEIAQYQYDSYLKEFTTKVKSVDDKYVVLEDTIFYPTSGGQPFDLGTMQTEDTTFNVVFVGKFNGSISHEVDKAGLKPGDIVTCCVDWNRRYKHMRSHTAAHVVAGIIEKEKGALITGNQITEEKVRIDFSLKDFNREELAQFTERANEIIKQDLDVHHVLIDRALAEKSGPLTNLAKGLDASIKTIRFVCIGDWDKQACGGTHVKSTAEIGTLSITKAENKGKNNRRIYFTLD